MPNVWPATAPERLEKPTRKSVPQRKRKPGGGKPGRKPKPRPIKQIDPEQGSIVIGGELPDSPNVIK